MINISNNNKNNMNNNNNNTYCYNIQNSLLISTNLQT